MPHCASCNPGYNSVKLNRLVFFAQKRMTGPATKCALIVLLLVLSIAVLVLVLVLERDNINRNAR